MAPVRTRPGSAPTAGAVRTTDELTERLDALRIWSGTSFRELHRGVVRLRRSDTGALIPAYDTVHRCLQPGRSRLDIDLVFDIARVLLGDDAEAAEWRQAAVRTAERGRAAGVVEVAADLPDDLESFVGRDDELAWLLAAIRGADREHTTVLVISGLAGVGKTSLAVRLAHQLAGTPPCVRLSVDLRGFDPDRPPADSDTVLAGFLRLLGVPGRRLAGLGSAERTALLSARLRGTRAVILLDDAADAEQVRPLLPDSPDCVVLVTSRRVPVGLERARQLALEVFTPGESLEFLRRAPSPGRVAAEPVAAARIAELVERLPLALAVVAGRIRSADWTLADHADRLEARRAGLRLDDGVAAALTSSHDALSRSQQRLLRMLALHPGRSAGAPAVAALLAADLGAVRSDLAELCAVNLLREPSPGRFEAHELVRVFAAERGCDEDSARERRAAVVRLYDHYRATAAAAMERYAPQERHRRPELPESGGPVVEFADRAAATEWLETERGNLIAIASAAADDGLGRYPVHLSVILANYLDTAAHYADAVLLHECAAAVAEVDERARIVAWLGAACWRLGRNDVALERFGESLAIARGAGDRRAEASALNNLALVLERFGRYQDALDAYRTAIEIAAELDDRLLLARGLGNRSVISERLGRYPEAMAEADRCLALCQDLGDAATESRALNLRGLVKYRIGRHADAHRDATRARELARAQGNRATEGYALMYLARTAEALGRPSGECRARALEIAREIANPDLESTVCNDLGQAARRAGDPGPALEHHRAALKIAEQVGDPFEQARAHDGIGACLAELGDLPAARHQLGEARERFEILGTPEAAEAAERLDRLSRRSGMRAPG